MIIGKWTVNSVEILNLDEAAKIKFVQKQKDFEAFIKEKEKKKKEIEEELKKPAPAHLGIIERNQRILDLKGQLFALRIVDMVKEKYKNMTVDTVKKDIMEEEVPKIEKGIFKFKEDGSFYSKIDTVEINDKYAISDGGKKIVLEENAITYPITIGEDESTLELEFMQLKTKLKLKKAQTE